MSVSCEWCVLSLRRSDHSSRGVLPSVLCLSVIVKPWLTLGCCAMEIKDEIDID